MRKIFILFNILFFSIISINAQNTANTRSNPIKRYMRPSVTILFVDRGDDRSKKMAEIVKNYPIPSKFNEHNISIKTIQLKPGAEFIKQTEKILTEKASNQIVAKWFNRNSNGEFNMDLISERGLYNASDADVMKSRRAERKEALLKDAGENLLDRSYILVYDIYNIKTLDEAKSSNASKYEGYQCLFDCYVFHLDWTDSVAAVFYNDYWVDASAPNKDRANKFESAKFPVKYVTRTQNMFGTIESSQQKEQSKSIQPPYKNDNKLFSGLFEKIVDIANVSLAKENEDFKVKVSVFSTKPVTAKIGKKEGLSVDKRFFVMEMEMDKKGIIKAKRKAVVRASTEISDNRQNASGETKPSKFYQIAGGRIWEGMLLQENPDWGFGFSSGWAQSEGIIGSGFHLMAELNLSLLASKMSDMPFTGIKLYADFAPFHSNKYNDPIKGNETFNFYDFTVGLSKDLNFAHAFVLVPFAGYGQVRDNDSTKLGSFGQIGCRLGLNIRYNWQILGSAGINFSADSFDDDRLVGIKKLFGTFYTVGLRYQF
jgi:PBP1b-binding outer membrane lipoprotein LpoB